MEKELTVVDLFAGCGGLSLGLEQAGFKPVFVSEINEDALESYLINREDNCSYLRHPDFHCHDVKDLVLRPVRLKKLQQALKQHGIAKRGDLDLLVGGPPCQGYSAIGHRRTYSVDKVQLPSNHLYQDMAFLVNVLRPKIFMFENVKGLLHSKWTGAGVVGETWADIFGTFAGLKEYTVKWDLVRAADYGVPQNRPRVLLVGIRNSVLSAMGPIHGHVASGFLPDPITKPPHPRELFGDLVDDAYPDVLSTKVYPKPATSKVQREFRRKLDGSIARKGDPLHEHDYSNHAPRIREKFEHMIDHHGEVPAHLETKKFAQRVIPAEWPDKGPFITATSMPDDYVHYLQPRTLTVREWARLQGFPDHYRFSGPRTTGGLRRAGNPREGLHARELPKYTQIGNAVPVQLARAVGRHFAALLRQLKSSRPKTATKQVTAKANATPR